MADLLALLGVLVRVRHFVSSGLLDLIFQNIFLLRLGVRRNLQRVHRQLVPPLVLDGSHDDTVAELVS